MPAKRLFAAFVVNTPLDEDRLKRAVWHVVARHESLRTALEHIDGELFQVIRDPVEITDEPCVVVDWDGTRAGMRRIVVELDDWWTVPRPLALKVMMARSADSRTLLLCLFNHACVDGMSVELVFDQIRRRYSGDGRADEAVPTQFADYYAGMVEDGLRVALDDWITLLDRVEPVVPPWMLESKLAADRAHIGTINWSFAEDTVALARAAARSRLCSQFEVLAAAAGIYFRRPDRAPAAIGVVHSGRHRAGGFDVVGLLRGFVVDVVEVGAGVTTATATAAGRDALRSALAHYARLPFEEVCRRSGRSPGWRTGSLGLWEVELNGTFARGLLGSMDDCAVHAAHLGQSEEVWCENGGPLLMIFFTIGGGGITGELRYIRPPVDGDMAACIARGIEDTVRFLQAGSDEPVDRAPAFHRLAGWSEPGSGRG
ncbi:condensation domain-containing protein [Nocardia abscessus]|uniref:condensation domain-containing protein n=1 Tax=Nocardia abscessus TaxID=120957 RepID=UPI00189305E8|nr:condensation domain-containing protein [Nocardia abscessus]MBF6221741.1 condensation domain-containing protein [Nocardia abscessus]